MGKIPKLEDCKTGLYPVEYNIVIAPEETETKTAGGIILAPTVKDQQDAAAMRGLLVGVSPLAFNYDNWPKGAITPKVGDHVYYAKYAGILVTGEDGKEYRMCKDKDVMAVIQPQTPTYDPLG